MVWHPDQAEFEEGHKMGPAVLAYSNGPSNSVHVGPRVSSKTFDPVIGHELVHVILFQKYKGAVPKWLEEGLANYVGKWGEIDYKRLASGGAPEDVRSLVHPFKGTAGQSGDLTDSARLHYMTSKALVEMIASKCSLRDLLQLSVGKSVENYLSTFCGIPDLNAEFKQWIAKKARGDQKAGGERKAAEPRRTGKKK
jgi:hypothetical protein